MSEDVSSMSRKGRLVQKSCRRRRAKAVLIQKTCHSGAITIVPGVGDPARRDRSEGRRFNRGNEEMEHEKGTSKGEPIRGVQ